MRYLFIVTTAVTISAASAQELATLDKPISTTIMAYKITAFSFEREPEWRFSITYQDNNGKSYSDNHHGPTTVVANNVSSTNPDGADEFLKQLNTANFTTISMTKRLLQHLVAHGKIPAATVTGAPETLPAGRVVK